MNNEHPTNGISVQLGRIEGKLDSLDARMDRQDSVLDAVRSHQEQMGLRVATCQGGAARREKRVSAMERQIRSVEVTGVINTTSGRVRWRTLATLGAVLVSLVSAAGVMSGMQCNGRAKTNHKQHQAPAPVVDARR